MKNGLITMKRLILKFMTSQPGKETVIVHIFPNISRIKDIEKIKYGHLIEYNMRNFFLEKSYTKCDQDWTYLGINNLEFYTVCFILYIENILKLSCKPPAFTSNKALLKNEKRSGTSLPVSFSAQFFKNKSCRYILSTDQTVLSGCHYSVEYWTICVL